MRLDVEHDVAELAVAARLLLVAPALHDRLLDGLAIADARAPPLDRDAETVGEPFGRDPQMHLALPPHDHLVGLRIVDDDERRVLLDELVEGKAELDVVLALFRRDRDGEHAGIRGDGRDGGVGLLARRQRVAGPGVIELAERDGFAGRSRPALLGHLSHHLGDAGHPAGLLGRRIERHAVADLAGQHPRHRELAAMGGVEGLEHIGDRIAVALDAEALRGRGDPRRFVTQRLHEAQHAVGAGRDAHQDRADEAVAKLLGEILEHAVARRRNVREQLLHQLVVVIGERLQHGEASILLAIEIVALELDHLRCAYAPCRQRPVRARDRRSR